MSSESVRALGHPRLTKPTRGAGLAFSGVDVMEVEAGAALVPVKIELIFPLSQSLAPRAATLI